MIETALVIVFGLLGGIAVGTQAPIAGAMGNRIGGAAGSLIVHLGGTAASLTLLLARGGESIQAWRTLPWYMLGCGAFGLVLYLSLAQTIPKLGATTAVTLIIIGQLLAGLVIDHFGAFGMAVRPLDPTRVIAVALLLGGAYLMIADV